MNIRHCLNFSKRFFFDTLSKHKISVIVKYEYCCNVISSRNSLSTNFQASDDRLIDITNVEDKISPLQPCVDDLSDYTKSALPSFNFAPFVNKSPVLRNMVKLGVELYKIQRKENVYVTILKLNEDDFNKYIKFLCDYLEPERLGKFITKNPYIFSQRLEDMETRINYLQSKKFSTDTIQSIVSMNPFWLNFSTRIIDKRLGWFQSQFNFTGDEVRNITIKEPRLITYSLRHIEKNKFTILEEMGFEEKECKDIVIKCPKLLMLTNKNLLGRFVYIHNTMMLSHETIVKVPKILYCRTSRLKQRHKFLQEIGRAQYDCTATNYVSPMDIASGTDAEFCLNVAKCSVDEYNKYLKSI